MYTNFTDFYTCFLYFLNLRNKYSCKIIFVKTIVFWRLLFFIRFWMFYFSSFRVWYKQFRKNVFSTGIKRAFAQGGGDFSSGLTTKSYTRQRVAEAGRRSADVFPSRSVGHDVVTRRPPLGCRRPPAASLPWPYKKVCAHLAAIQCPVHPIIIIIYEYACARITLARNVVTDDDKYAAGMPRSTPTAVYSVSRRERARVYKPYVCCWLRVYRRRRRCPTTGRVLFCCRCNIMRV